MDDHQAARPGFVGLAGGRTEGIVNSASSLHSVAGNVNSRRKCVRQLPPDTGIHAAARNAARQRRQRGMALRDALAEQQKRLERLEYDDQTARAWLEGFRFGYRTEELEAAA